MAKQSDIPGLDQTGMFFEHYEFDPISTFIEEDLVEIVKFIDITFNDGNVPPHPEHFTGQVFAPQRGITVTQFADILTAMNINIIPEALPRLPETLQSHFDDGKFCPFDDFDLAELNNFLTRFVRLRINAEQFNSLSNRLKKQFMVFTRDGKNWRFGNRRPSG